MKKGKDVEMFLGHGIDIPGRTIALKGAVDEDMLDICMRGFHLMPEGSDVLVTINSPGGDLAAGFGIYDIIKAHGGQVTARVVGEACSVACLILQAADVREASPNSCIMHHVGSASASDHAKNMELWLGFYKQMQDRMNAILLEQINERRMEQSLEPRSKSWFKEHNMWDRWLWPEEAIELGLLDRIWRG